MNTYVIKVVAVRYMMPTNETDQYYISSVMYDQHDMRYPMCSYTNNVCNAKEFNGLYEARKLTNRLLTRKTRIGDFNIAKAKVVQTNL